MASYFNRYKPFNQQNNTPVIVPYLKIPDKGSDRVIIWTENERLDNISDDYYGTPFFDWLIMQKNASLGMDEFEWEYGSTVIIPYPLETSLNQYIEAYERYKVLNL